MADASVHPPSVHRRRFNCIGNHRHTPAACCVQCFPHDLAAHSGAQRADTTSSVVDRRADHTLDSQTHPCFARFPAWDGPHFGPWPCVAMQPVEACELEQERLPITCLGLGRQERERELRSTGGAWTRLGGRKSIGLAGLLVLACPSGPLIGFRLLGIPPPCPL